MKIREVLIAADQLINTLLGGYSDETMSARCWRLRDDQPYKIIRPVIDGLFFWDKGHCRTSFESEQRHIHSPAEEQ